MFSQHHFSVINSLKVIYLGNTDCHENLDLTQNQTTENVLCPFTFLFDSWQRYTKVASFPWIEIVVFWSFSSSTLIKDNIYAVNKLKKNKKNCYRLAQKLKMMFAADLTHTDRLNKTAPQITTSSFRTQWKDTTINVLKREIFRTGGCCVWFLTKQRYLPWHSHIVARSCVMLSHSVRIFQHCKNAVAWVNSWLLDDLVCHFTLFTETKVDL